LWGAGGSGTGSWRRPSSGAGTGGTENGRYYAITLKKLTAILKIPFLPESPFEILDFDPGLFEDPDQGPLLQFAVKRDRKDTPFFLHDNVARSLTLCLEPVLCKILNQIFPGDNRKLMRHPPLRPSRFRGGVLEIS